MYRARTRRITALLVAASFALTIACRPDANTESGSQTGTQEASPTPTETMDIAACRSDDINERVTALNQAITERIENSPFADQFRDGKFTIKAEKRTRVIEDKEGKQNVDYIALTVKGSLHGKGRAGFESLNGLVKPYLGAKCVTELTYGGSIQDPSDTSEEAEGSEEFQFFKWGWCEDGKQVCADGECRDRCTNKL